MVAGRTLSTGESCSLALFLVLGFQLEWKHVCYSFQDYLVWRFSRPYFYFVPTVFAKSLGVLFLRRFSIPLPLLEDVLFLVITSSSCQGSMTPVFRKDFSYFVSTQTMTHFVGPGLCLFGHYPYGLWSGPCFGTRRCFGDIYFLFVPLLSRKLVVAFWLEVVGSS